MKYYIKETVLKDIVDIISDVKDYDQFDSYIKKLRGGRSMKSIASGSSAMTLVFPCLCTNALSLNVLSTINKVNETKAVEMLQVLFSAIQTTRIEDIRDYISKFHSNLDDRLTVDNVLDNIERIVDLSESVDYRYIDEKLSNKEIEFICREDYRNIQLSEVKDEYNLDSIDFYRIKENYNDYDIIKEDTTILFEKGGSEKGRGFTKKFKDSSVDKSRYYASGSRSDRYDIDWAGGTLSNDHVEKKYTGSITNNYFGQDKKEKSGTSPKDYKDMVDAQRNSMPKVNNVEITKQNDIVGIQLMVTVNYINSDGIRVPLTFLVVVKSKLYILESNDIIEKLVEKTRDKNLFSKIVKVYSGEISFFRDFVFAIDKAKKDALSQSSLNPTSSKLWRMLERRSSKSKLHRVLNTKNSAIAISTLVISKEEVEYIKRYHNIDLERSAIVRSLMDSYNLLCFVIADEVNETASFLYDTGDDEFETVSFAGMEKEVREGPYRKSLQLMITSNK